MSKIPEIELTVTPPVTDKSDAQIMWGEYFMAYEREVTSPEKLHTMIKRILAVGYKVGQQDKASQIKNILSL